MAVVFRCNGANRADETPVLSPHRNYPTVPGRGQQSLCGGVRRQTEDVPKRKNELHLRKHLPECEVAAEVGSGSPTEAELGAGGCPRKLPERGTDRQPGGGSEN